jgi:hypothetical protein
MTRFRAKITNSKPTRVLQSWFHVACYFIFFAIAATSPALSQSGTLYGFTPFPYDMTVEAVSKTYEISEKYSTLYAVQLDDGIPWKEAMSGEPWPKDLQEKWDDFKKHRPQGRKMALSIAPLAEDRKSRAPAAKDSFTPLGLMFASFNSVTMKEAYLNYVQRVVEFFHPDYLNIGQEAGELAFHDAATWTQFEELFHHVRKDIKRISPNTAVGISFNLQMLMNPAVAERSKTLIADSDFVGISFYPYMSPEYQRYGLPALPPAPEMWKTPLNWLKNYTTKPIAIFETGFTSANVDITEDKVTLKGTADLQANYLRDLAGIAQRDNYLFVVWFMPVDYDKLFTHIETDNDYHKIWQRIGFFDTELNPKPAWEVWKSIVGAGSSQMNLPLQPETKSQNNFKSSSQGNQKMANGEYKIDFDSTSELFTSDANNHFAVMPNGYKKSSAMHWSFTYQGGVWQWGVKPVSVGALGGLQITSVALRSNREGPIMVQLEEEGGEAFFAIVMVGKDWRVTQLRTADFKVDPAKTQDNRLTMESVKQILIADPAATSDDTNATGNRDIWFENWKFYAR